jgi:hypothetical protein
VQRTIRFKFEQCSDLNPVPGKDGIQMPKYIITKLRQMQVFFEKYRLIPAIFRKTAAYFSEVA